MSTTQRGADHHEYCRTDGRQRPRIQVPTSPLHVITRGVGWGGGGGAADARSDGRASSPRAAPARPPGLWRGARQPSHSSMSPTPQYVLSALEPRRTVLHARCPTQARRHSSDGHCWRVPLSSSSRITASAVVAVVVDVVTVVAAVVITAAAIVVAAAAAEELPSHSARAAAGEVAAHPCLTKLYPGSPLFASRLAAQPFLASPSLRRIPYTATTSLPVPVLASWAQPTGGPVRRDCPSPTQRVLPVPTLNRWQRPWKGVRPLSKVVSCCSCLPGVPVCDTYRRSGA